MTDHKTNSNPTGEVRQCLARHIHEPHEYQADFGSYFDVYCPGNTGQKKEKQTDDEDQVLPYGPINPFDIFARCNRCGAIVEGNVAGQVIHNVWHDDEGRRVRNYSGSIFGF